MNNLISFASEWVTVSLLMDFHNDFEIPGIHDLYSRWLENSFPLGNLEVSWQTAKTERCLFGVTNGHAVSWPKGLVCVPRWLVLAWKWIPPSFPKMIWS